jgi:transcriptional regulator of acetoin/glycerol metabolism
VHAGIVRCTAEAEVAVPSRDQLAALLQAHGGVVADVARVTGRSRKQVYRWIDQHGLSDLRKSLLGR